MCSSQQMKSRSYTSEFDTTTAVANIGDAQTAINALNTDAINDLTSPTGSITSMKDKLQVAIDTLSQSTFPKNYSRATTLTEETASDADFLTIRDNSPILPRLDGMTAPGGCITMLETAIGNLVGSVQTLKLQVQELVVCDYHLHNVVVRTRPILTILYCTEQDLIDLVASDATVLRSDMDTFVGQISGNVSALCERWR